MKFNPLKLSFSHTMLAFLFGLITNLLLAQILSNIAILPILGAILVLCGSVSLLNYVKVKRGYVTYKQFFTKGLDISILTLALIILSIKGFFPSSQWIGPLCVFTILFVCTFANKNSSVN